MLFRKELFTLQTQNVRKNVRKESGSLPNQKRTFPSLFFCLGRVSSGASLTVEAAFVLPLFLYVMVGVLYFINIVGNAGAWISVIHDTVREMGVYAYAVRNPDAQTKAVSGCVSAGYASVQLKKSVEKANNFSLYGSTFLSGEDTIDLVVTYRMENQASLFSLGNFRIRQRGFVRAWTGKDFREYVEEEESGKRETVYVTEHGVVYHKNKKCTYLKLSIRRVSKDVALRIRNQYGAKYYACGCCRSGTGNFVYITNSGSRYHANEKCSGLKRTIKTMDSSMTGRLPPCSKCAK